MNLKNSGALLGKQADTEVIVDLLRFVGHVGIVRIKNSDTDAYVNNEKMGVSLLFESERYVHDEYGLDLPSEAPVLVAIFIYGPGHSEFSTYQGDIYGDLLFTDGQDTARRKLGGEGRFSEMFNSESWDFTDKTGIILDYSEGKNGIRMIQFGIEL